MKETADQSVRFKEKRQTANFSQTDGRKTTTGRQTNTGQQTDRQTDKLTNRQTKSTN